jgi:hypothetical protein
MVVQCTWLYTVVNGSTWLSKVGNYCKRLYTVVHGFTTMYIASDGCRVVRGKTGHFLEFLAFD